MLQRETNDGDDDNENESFERVRNTFQTVACFVRLELRHVP